MNIIFNSIIEREFLYVDPVSARSIRHEKITEGIDCYRASATNDDGSTDMATSIPSQ